MSKSTMDQKIETFIKKANDDMCRVYLNLSPIGDVCMDYLVKSDNPKYTHMYETLYHVSYFHMRLNKKREDQLKTTGKTTYECSSYFYKENMALVPKPHQVTPDIPACLFIVGFEKDKVTYKNKQFWAAKYDKCLAAECYAQTIFSPEEKKTKVRAPKQYASTVQAQPVILHPTLYQMYMELAKDSLEKYGAVQLKEDFVLTIPKEYEQGN